MKQNQRQLWLRWVGANAFGELFGLGLTFLITGYAFSKLDNQQTITSILLAFFFAVASGAVEATIVGLAQWWAMHPWFPTIEKFAWWRGTLIGALIAYVLGYLPSTIMDMGEATASSAPAVEPPQWIILLLAARAGRGRRSRAVLCAMAGDARQGEARGIVDPCQHAGMVLRNADHLSGALISRSRCLHHGNPFCSWLAYYFLLVQSSAGFTVHFS